MPRARRRLSHAHRLVGLLIALSVAGCSAKISAPPEPPVAVRLGDEAFATQDYEGAIRDYETYLAQVQRGDYTAHAYYKKSLAAYRLGDHAGAIAALDQLAATYPGSRWVQADALRGDAEVELGRVVPALVAWDGAWSQANEIERPKLRSRVDTLAKAASGPELAAARDQVKNPEVAAMLDAELSQRVPPAIHEPLPGEVGSAAVAATQGADDASAPPATVLAALRSSTAKRGTAGSPAYERGEGMQRGPNRHPAWRATATTDENVIVDESEGAPGGLVKLDIADDGGEPVAEVVVLPEATTEATPAAEPLLAVGGARLERLDGLSEPAREAAPAVEAAPAEREPEPAPARTRLERIDGPWGEPL